MYEVFTASYQCDGKTYTGYGIRHNELTIADLSLDGKAVETLVKLCNLHELHPCHMFEIAQDFAAI